MRERNTALRAARERLPSRCAPGGRMTRAELADAALDYAVPARACVWAARSTFRFSTDNMRACMIQTTGT